MDISGGKGCPLERSHQIKYGEFNGGWLVGVIKHGKGSYIWREISKLGREVMLLGNKLERV